MFYITIEHLELVSRNTIFSVVSGISINPLQLGGEADIVNPWIAPKIQEFEITRGRLP